MTVTTVASVSPNCHNPATATVPLLDWGRKVVPSIRQCTQRQQPLFVQLWPVVLPVCNGIRYFWKSKNSTTTYHTPLEPAVSYGLSIIQPSSRATLNPQRTRPSHPKLLLKLIMALLSPLLLFRMYSSEILSLSIVFISSTSEYSPCSYVEIPQIVCLLQQHNIYPVISQKQSDQIMMFSICAASQIVNHFFPKTDTRKHVHIQNDSSITWKRRKTGCYVLRMLQESVRWCQQNS